MLKCHVIWSLESLDVFLALMDFQKFCVHAALAVKRQEPNGTGEEQIFVHRPFPVGVTKCGAFCIICLLK